MGTKQSANPPRALSHTVYCVRLHYVNINQLCKDLEK